MNDQVSGMAKMHDQDRADKLAAQLPTAPEGTAIIALLEQGGAVVVELKSGRERLMTAKGTLSTESTRGWRETMDWHAFASRPDDLFRAPIIAAMKAQGMSQTKAAEAAGVSQGHMSDFLKGKQGMVLPKLASLMATLGIATTTAKWFSGKT